MSKSTFNTLSIFLLIAFLSSNLMSQSDTHITKESAKVVDFEKNEVKLLPNGREVNIIQPSFKGGQEEMFIFIQKNLQYPKKAINDGKEGTVYVSFTVLSNGTVTDGKIIKSIENGIFDEEVLRIISIMPKWNPGKNGNKMVDSSMTLPINFALKK